MEPQLPQRSQDPILVFRANSKVEVVMLPGPSANQGINAPASGDPDRSPRVGYSVEHSQNVSFVQHDAPPLPGRRRPAVTKGMGGERLSEVLLAAIRIVSASSSRSIPAGISTPSASCSAKRSSRIRRAWAGKSMRGLGIERGEAHPGWQAHLVDDGLNSASDRGWRDP